MQSVDELCGIAKGSTVIASLWAGREIMRLALAAVALFQPAILYAGGWDVLGEHEKLDGQTVIEAGKVSELSPRFGTTGNVDLYLFGSRCFAFYGYPKPYGLYGDQAGLLLADPNTSKLSVAILKPDASDVEVKVYAVTLYECPSGAGPLDTPEAVERYSREIQREAEEVLRKVKEQQTQNELLYDELRRQVEEQELRRKELEKLQE